MMNKFLVFSCLETPRDKPKDVEYDGPVVVLACSSDPSFMLFFPISEENGKIIRYVMNGSGEYDVDTNVLGIFRTMVDSWEASDRYLAGILMDISYERKSKEDILMVNLAICSQTGELDSIVHVNFVHAILLAALEKVEILVSDRLLEKLVPEDEGLSDKRKKQKEDISLFPEDKDLLKIVKDIMSGNIKDN